MTLPSNWTIGWLGELATEVRNGISLRPDSDRGQPILRISAVRPMNLDTSDIRFLPGSSAQWSPYRLHLDDLLFTRYNGNPHLVGVCARVQAEPACQLVYPDKLIRVRVDTAVAEPAYVEKVVNTGMSRAAIEAKLKTSAGQVGIAGGELKEIPIPLPPLAEQRRIVAKIESLFARSRRAKQALLAIPPLLDRLRQSILAAAFHGELTTEWRKQHSGTGSGEDLLQRARLERRRRWESAEATRMVARGRATNGEAWKSKYRDAVPAEPSGSLPRGWTWASLDELTLIVGGITKGQKRGPGERLRPVPYLRVANVQRGFLDLTDMKEIAATAEEIRELRLEVGDILLNEGGDRDKLGRGWVWGGEIPECIHQNHVFRARPVMPEVDSQFLSHYANNFGQQFFLDAGAQTTNLASVSMTKIRALPVPLAPAGEQREIVRILTNRLAAIDRTRALLVAALEENDDLQSSILAKAFRGELVPQDPNDEPASALLERLRAGHQAGDGEPKRKRRSPGE
jgi:type I restriction enzyme S subunit